MTSNPHNATPSRPAIHPDHNGCQTDTPANRSGYYPAPVGLPQLPWWLLMLWALTPALALAVIAAVGCWLM